VTSPPEPPPLLIDTSSLLRARLNQFVEDRSGEPEGHELAVIDALVLYDKVLLDGPSVERNMHSLDWLLDIDDGIEIVELDSAEVSALYRSADEVVAHVQPNPRNVDFMRVHMPHGLGAEVGQRFAPSTYWEDLERDLDSADLRRLQEIFADAFGEHVPFAGAPFIVLARLCYYLALQQSTASSLLLDPLKAFETPQFSHGDTARSILDLFDSEVRTAFEERQAKWLGGQRRDLKLPLLSRFIVETAREKGWSSGRAITEMRQSREVQLFRSGLAEMQQAVDTNDVKALDAIFEELDAAASAWTRRIGAPPSQRQLAITVTTPLISVGKELSVPRLRRRSTGEKLLVLVDRLLSDDY